MRVLTWLHGPAFAAGAVAVVVNRAGLGPLWFTGVGLIVFGLAARWLTTRAQRPPRGAEPGPVAVGLPLAGRWTALNGPGTKVPSHTHALAQTYAIDLVLRPAPEPVWLWPVARRPQAYPAFGAPLLAPADARVVAAADGQRDHLTRTSLPGLLYLLRRALCAPSAGPGTCWATTSSSTSATACTRCTRTSGGVRCGWPPVTWWRPASRWPSAATRATRPSRTCTSS
nr:hypothetical protein [Jiangella alba]